MGAKKLTEEEETLLGEVHGSISSLVDELEVFKFPSREFSIVFTKLEEAEMWMQRGFERFGYEPIDADAEEDEGEEDEETPDEAPKSDEEE